MTFRSKLQLLIAPCILCPALLVIAMTFFITGSKIKAMQYEILDNHLNRILSLCETEYDLIKKLKMENDQYYSEAVMKKVLSEIRQTQNQHEKILIVQTAARKLIYFTGHDHDVGKKALSDISYIDEMISTKTGRIEFRERIDEHSHKTNIAVYRYYSNWDWLIAVSLTKDDVYKYVYSATYMSLFITAIFLIIVFMISYRISLGISKPLEQLAAGTIKIAQQDYDINIEIKSKGEFSDIAEKFNMMAQKIKEYARSIRKFNQELEHRVAERTRELETARNKSQQYLDIAGVILVAIDADRRVTLINQKGCEVLEGTAEEIIGKDWFETFVPDNMRQDVIQAFHRLMSGEIEPVEHFENPVLTIGGRERIIAWHNALLRDDGGSIVGTLSSGEDITEQKRAEKQITSLNQNLLNRTVALEAANKDLEAFAYSVSHDLRAPLRHIDGFLELLQKKAGTALDGQNRHYMEIISDSAKKMGLLIDDLLSFSRMGRQAMTFKQVDLRPLVHDVIRELEPDAAGRTIDWCIGDLPEVEGDAAMLRMVLANLIANALKFTRPRQQARIEIGSLSGRDSDTVIFVRDNGVGFDMTYADKLFGVFQRLHRADEFEGIGIGLANVRRIIARHGGRTWAEGQINQGAVFYFSLPRSFQGA
ncbi:MAG: ATP-binding protein [Desulfobacteraceae bacterium]|jgi:PAS domain S-box-containing protein